MLSRGVVIAGRVVAICAVLAAGVAAYLVFLGVEGCGTLADQATWEYARGLRPAGGPASCAEPLARRGAGVVVAAKAAAMLFVIAGAVEAAGRFGRRTRRHTPDEGPQTRLAA